MTNQDNSKLSPSAINEVVARKLGLKHVGLDKDGDLCYWPHELGLKGDRYKVPDYCTSITAAWKILEGFEFWTVKKIINGYLCRLWPDGKADVGAEADTAPMVICLAFLKLGDNTL